MTYAMPMITWYATIMTRICIFQQQFQRQVKVIEGFPTKVYYADRSDKIASKLGSFKWGDPTFIFTQYGLSVATFYIVLKYEGYTGSKVNFWNYKFK